MKHALLKITLLIFCFFFIPCVICAQQNLRFQLWAHIESPPSNEKNETHNLYARAAENVKTLTAFILEGMLSGWNFSYTPSDKLRGVQDFFDFSPIQTFQKNDPRLVFDAPTRDENRLYCWVTYRISAEQEKQLQSWQSVQYPKIQGSGSASLFDGLTAINDAYALAVQNAVRSYAQTLIKNKPKEITGTVLLTGIPRLRVVSGRYVVDVTLYLAIKEIIPYAVF